MADPTWYPRHLGFGEPPKVAVGSRGEVEEVECEEAGERWVSVMIDGAQRLIRYEEQHKLMLENEQVAAGKDAPPEQPPELAEAAEAELQAAESHNPSHSDAD